MQHPHPSTIVVIEDNPADLFLLRHALEQDNREYVLKALPDGEQAMEFCKQCGRDAESKPCVIVLDLHLPKYDGTVILRTIRRNPALAHVRVVVLTTLGSPAEEREVRELGVRLYRSKPFHLEDWYTLAREILDVCDEKIPVVA